MSHCSPLTILLIDDCARDREAYCRFLKQDSLYTYRILKFETAAQSMKWCQQEVPDIILLDYGLPDGDGLKFIQQLRKYHSNTQVAVILLVGQGDEIIAVRAMKSGVQDYLVKDKLTAEVLQGAIHHAVERMQLTRQLEQSREYAIQQESACQQAQAELAESQRKEAALRSLLAICSDRVIKSDKDSNSLHIVGCNIEISDELPYQTLCKQAQQELIHNIDLREAIFNESADAIFLVDPQTLLTLDCNRRAVELFEAADKTELIGINGQALQLRPFTASETDAIVADMQIKGVWSREIEYITLKGKIFWGNIAAKPITVAGRTMHLIRLTDITERKQAEAQMRQTNEQLARATRLKDEFLANMSHELRTPLNAILGMSEGLQEDVFGSINERQVNAIATIERSGRHLLELINDILDLSKIESGKLELQWSDVSVRCLCDASLVFVKQMALKKNIHLSIHVAENIDSIQGDDRRLRQVLINLLNNAVKFTPEGGSVTLEVRLEETEEQGSKGNSPLSSLNLCFYINDTGIGIAHEEISKLFQPFIQLDSSLNRQHSGTGLGLALVQQIVSLHKGTVSVSSEVGEGSCFTVRIPYRPSANLLTMQVTTLLPSYCLLGENAQVLIIEDSMVAADQITRYFSEMGMLSIIYSKGEGAIEEALRVQPGLIILDLQLPNLSGWEVLNQLKTNPKTKNIPAIIISVVDERSKGLTEGAFEYLVKPITRAQLQVTIEKLQYFNRSESPNLTVLPKAATKPPLILLVEDNQANIDTISGYLESRGYHLILANNGQQAIDLVRVQRPDLILMDIQMPGMDGLKAMRHIRDDRKFGDIPIIALTALAMAGDRETCLAAGANEYLTKPVKLRQLTLTIQQVLAR